MRFSLRLMVPVVACIALVSGLFAYFQVRDQQRSLRQELDQQKYDSLVQTGLILERHLPIAPGAAVLRVVVRDSNSGSMGSVTIPLKSVVPAIQ